MPPKMVFRKSGSMGIFLTVGGAALLLFVFFTAYGLFQLYSASVSDFSAALNVVLVAAVQAMFLGVMGWVGSIMLVRGVDFFKIDRGVGVVTFKVEKGVGIATITEEPKSSKKSKKVKK